MRVIVDTHVFFWWLIVDEGLSARALEILENEENEVLISSVVAWELATKSRIGKWPDGKIVAEKIEEYLASYELRQLPITIAHAQLGGLMPGVHKDPFDRILAAQARLEGIPLVTSDRALREFGIEILW